MTVTLSLFAGAGAQFFDNNGTILSGGKIYTYLAGTTTPLAVYTTNSQTAFHTNPIILDSAGRVPSGGEIWLQLGIGYKFVLKTSTDVLIATYDNIPSSAQPPAANDADSIMYEQGYTVSAGSFVVGKIYRIAFVGTTNFTLIGATNNTIGTHFIATGVGTGTGTAELSQTVETKLRETISVKDFGAVGDGVADDTNAFIGAAAQINAQGGGVLYVPTGTYKVFRQTANPSPSINSPYWVSAGDIIRLDNCDGVRIVFDGAELIAADGLKYGSFDPLTGAVYNPPAGTFTNDAYAAAPGDFIRLENCKNVEIINPIFNGNNVNYVVGGRWGNTGIQLANRGVVCSYSENIRVTNGTITYCGLDGLYVRGLTGQRVNVMFENIRTSYNGRQGFSWVGGEGVTAVNCVFEKTGKGGISSAPRAGLDIEDNGQGCRDGLFENCEFFDNEGLSCLILGTTDRISFERCVFANPAPERTIWSDANGISFLNCDIYGNLSNLSTTLFEDCYITNKPYKTFTSMFTNIVDTSQSATFRNCTIDCYNTDSHNFNIRGNTVIENCTFLMSQTNPPQKFRAGYIGGTVTDTKFVQNYTFTSGAPDITIDGEYTFIDQQNEVFYGQTTITGTGLAFPDRFGSRNVLLAALRQTNYTEETLYTLSGAGPTFDIDVGTGNHILMLYKTSGNTTLRNVAAMYAVTSTLSTNAARHSYLEMVSRETDLGGGGSVAMVLSGSTDVIRFTEGTVPLDGEIWRVRKVALSGVFLPV